jgi:Ca2+/H+ antiporter
LHFVYFYSLSYLTEQVAEHTNGTIGALLNATFGNAPELLISVAALRSGFYRVVQLTMLGSMITNMILVFGVSCLIGGLRWQVQDLRLTSGNVSVGMLLMATAGSLIPAALVLSGQFTPTTSGSNNRQLNRTILGAAAPTQEEVTLSRVNAAVMLIAYLCYIVFQLGTHMEEFDERIEERPAQPNVFCRKLCSKCTMSRSTGETDHPRKDSSDVVDRGLKKRQSNLAVDASGIGVESDEESHHFSDEEEALLLHQFNASHTEESFAESYGRLIPDISERRKRRHRRRVPEKVVDTTSLNPTNGSPKKALATGISMTKSFDSFLNEDHISLDDLHRLNQDHPAKDLPNPALSLHVGVIWLFVITLCVSAISDILVDTIDEFALRMNLSQVFTSMIIVPFFSNVAEQVSAFLFAYRNEMDLVVGVTIGSAIQIATFVLPGSVLIGYVMDRSMTLYFHSYETVCLLLCTLIVAAVLQGGTTNWLVGVMLLGVYIMFAAGIWFHEIENLSVDTEELVEAVH